ncbi:MAG: hypothetical protein JWO58_1774 [Chitinophagaceae bacterium]|nr:hypothetical protein [Chitinophagaceae bacterium]
MKRNTLILLLHALFWTQNVSRNLVFDMFHNPYVIFVEQSLIASLCYLNYFFFFPYILKKNKLSYYIIWIIVFWGGFTVIYASWLFFLLPYLFDIKIATRWAWIGGFNISFLYAAMSSGSRLLADWSNNQSMNEKLMLQKTSAQIQWVKSNVNIPFMLQALDHAEKVALESPKKAEQSIMFLSDVLRYGLYESESEYVSLNREIEIIEEYVLLQHFITPDTPLQLIVQGNPNGLKVTPNILLRFINVWRTEMSTHHLPLNPSLVLICQLQSLQLNLPVGDIQDSILKQIIQKNTSFNNLHFTISYGQEAGYVFLKIINLDV